MNSDNWPIVMYDGNGVYLQIDEDGQMFLDNELVTDDKQLREFLYLYAKGKAE